MKKIILALIVACLALSTISADDPTAYTELRDLSNWAADAIVDIAAREGIDHYYPGPITYNSTEIELSNLIKDMVNSKIMEKTRNITIIMSGGANAERIIYTMGRIYYIDEVILFHLDIIDQVSGNILGVIERELPALPGIVSQMVSIYGDDYSVIPVVDMVLEPNNSRVAAQMIDLDTYIDELALTPGDTDWFYFDVDSVNEPLGLYITTEGDLDTVMEIYSEDEMYDYLMYSDDFNGSNAGGSLIIEEPGRYYVMIRGYGDSTNGYYGLYTEFGEVEYADEYEPDNDMENANVLESGDRESHSFNMSDSADYYVFTLERTTYISAFTTGYMDTTMMLLDEDGGYITENDDGGEDSNALIEERLSAGTYYLVVEPYSSGNEGDYVIEFLVD